VARPSHADAESDLREAGTKQCNLR
jgi:hypothetical protein